MKLTHLLKDLKFEVLNGELTKDVKGISDKSRESKKDYIFFAIVGTKVSGENYIKEAVDNGVSCVIVENEQDNYLDDVTYIKVDSVRKAMSIISKNFYMPHGINFKLIGITGTNGKTTTSFMIGETLYNAGYNVCVVGTSGIFINGEELRGEGLTTPDPIDLFRLFSFCSSIYIDYIIMEVSAHALALDKIYGLVFDYAIFSNLTEDHLDFFGDMQTYGKAKLKLFDKNFSKCAIVNLDDDFGKTIHLLRGDDIITYGRQAEYEIKKLTNNSFNLRYNNKNARIKLTMPGVYNFYNAASAIAVLIREKISIKTIKKSLKNLKIVSGRFNVFKTKNHGRVILDFAHTPDGLEKLLTNVKEVVGNGRIISLFGCGGNRDKQKRPIMGEISAKNSDFTIISIDNPRYENADSVMRDIEVGVKKISDNYEIIMPRSKAIQHAISMSSPSDVVVVSGKGTEPYYEIDGVKDFYREDIVIQSVIRHLER